MKTIKITEIQIVPIKPRNGLIAFASVVLEHSVYLGSLGVYTKLDSSGYRITYPTKKVGDRNINIYHPINKETSKAIEGTTISKKVEPLGFFNALKEIKTRIYNI